MNGTGYQVVGVMEEKYFSFDHKHNVMRWMNRQIYVPLTTLVTRRGEPLENGRVSFMNARMRDVKKADDAVDQIRRVLQREHGTNDYEVRSRVANLKRNAEQNQMYDVTFMACGLISLLVGGIVVMNIQLASFNERVREVGTRKAVGASPAQIFVQFLSETVLVSFLGGFLGLFVGKLFTEGIAKLTRDPAIITPATIVWALVFACGTGLFFGMYPAIRASRLSPIEALRTE
jgi:putative ABC transport system permease protein